MTAKKIKTILIILAAMTYIGFVIFTHVKSNVIDSEEMEIIGTITASDNVFMEGGEQLTYNWISNYTKLDDVGCPIWGIKLLGNYADNYFTENGCASSELVISNVETNSVDYKATIKAVNKDISATFVYNIVSREWKVEN